jgi:molybdate transport system regulatory protein
MAKSGGSAAGRAAGLRIRLVLEDGVMLGPGKADLLDGIRDTGSIAAAGRRMGMSYKRAWLLVETMNAVFAQPLVETARGGAGFGGARLTATGERVLGLYRTLQAKAASAAAGEVAALRRLAAEKARES